MEPVKIPRPNASTCTICGAEKKQSETWFLVTENEWQDRLNVWKWNPQMTVQQRVHALCSPWHVRELVVHWMATGCLDYPFAEAAGGSERKLKLDQAGHPRLRCSGHLAEIAVDRDGLARVLNDNPLLLNTILGELVAVLEKELPQSEEAEIEDEASFAAPFM